LNSSPIFIGGAGRSGTTLLRVILDSHPNIACGPELKVTPQVAQMWLEFQTVLKAPLREYHLSAEDINRLFGRFLISILENYRKRIGKQRIAEKSPNNVFFFAHLAQMFPESPLIHVVRDGRDVVCSLLTMDWSDPGTGERVEYTRDSKKAAQYWVNAVRAGREALKSPLVERNYMELHYENLVEKPEPTLKKLFEFIKEPWDPTVLNYHQRKHDLAGESSANQVSQPLYKSAMHRWVCDLKPVDKQIVKEVAGHLLIELGYANDFNW